MYELPVTVEICGNEYRIRNDADYRVILDCIAIYQDSSLSTLEKTIGALTMFYDCIEDEDDVLSAFGDINEAVTAMMKFISVDEDVGHKVQHKLIDWVQDEKLIVSAVNSVAKTEIRALPYLHWWTFMAHYMAIGECPLSMIVGIRDKITKGKKLEKHEQEFRRNNPQHFTWRTRSAEDENAEKQINDLWNK